MAAAGEVWLGSCPRGVGSPPTARPFALKYLCTEHRWACSPCQCPGPGLSVLQALFLQLRSPKACGQVLQTQEAPGEAGPILPEWGHPSFGFPTLCSGLGGDDTAPRLVSRRRRKGGSTAQRPPPAHSTPSSSEQTGKEIHSRPQERGTEMAPAPHLGECGSQRRGWAQEQPPTPSTFTGVPREQSEARREKRSLFLRVIQKIHSDHTGSIVMPNTPTGRGPGSTEPAAGSCTSLQEPIRLLANTELLPPNKKGKK